jgi:hypothetical protein
MVYPPGIGACDHRPSALRCDAKLLAARDGILPIERMPHAGRATAKIAV